MEDMEEREVEEAECRGESTGDAAAVEGDDMSDSAVVEVMVRRSTGFFLAAGRLLDVAVVAILRVNWLYSATKYGRGCWCVKQAGGTEEREELAGGGKEPEKQFPNCS